MIWDKGVHLKRSVYATLHPMASRAEIEQGLEILRLSNQKIGHPGSRLHKEGAQEVAALTSALEHPCCGSCDHLDINQYWGQGRPQVSLACNMNHSPRSLWFNWIPGDATPACVDCTDPQGRPKLEP